MLRKTPLALMPVVLALAACSPLAGPGAGGATPSPQSTDDTVSGTPGGPAGSPEPPSHAPQPADEDLSRGQAFVDASDLRIAESYPPQIFLYLAGALPTPCHQLRVAVTTPDPHNRIDVDVYSVVEPDVVCIQVLEAFEENVALGSFPAGTYTVWVNGQLVGEFAV